MPIDYEFKIADKSYTVSRDEIEENGGMSKFAEFYPDATIRMKRDEDGKEFDIPVSEYEWATGRGMRPWKIERKTVVKAPGSDNRTSNQSASVNNDNLSTPTPASADENTSSVMVETDSVSTPQPIDDRGYVFSAEDIDKIADVGEQSATASQENDAMLSDERQETTTRVGNAQEQQKQQKQSIPTSPLIQMAEERKKQLSGYLSDYFNNVSQKVNSAINKPEQIEVPKDENGNDIYPSAVDLLELSLKETEPALKELAKNTREEVIKSVRQKYGDLMMKANGPVDFSREMQEEEAPSKVLEAALAKVRNDENYKKLIAAEANRLEIDVEDYIEDIVKPILQNEIYGIEIESRRPKTAGEYWLGRAVGGSMLGMMNSIANDPLEVRQLNEAAMQAYNPNQVEEIAGTFGSIVMDLPFMAITGGIGSQAGKAVLYPTVQRLVAQGVSKPIAWGIATRAAQRNALGYGVRVASEAVNFATLEGLGSTIGQAYMTGDVDAGKVGAAFGKGAVTGATMGIFGISNEALGRTFTKQLGEGVGRVGTYTTSLGGRTAILTGSSVVGQWMEDPNFDINNVDWTNEFVHAGLINIGFDVIGVIKRAGKEKMNVRPEDLYLSKENIRQLNDAGFKGKNAAEIAENLLKGRTKIKESADAGLVGREQQGVRQESDPIYSELSRLLQDSSIDLSTKSKVAYLMTGMVHQLSPNTSISDVIDANGEYVVEKYNTSGQTNEQRRFSTKEEAQQYIKESRSEIKGNQVRALEEMMNTAGRIASATSLFDMIAKDSGISREQLMDIYVRGRKGEPLNQQEKGIYKTTEQILQSTKEVKTYHYDIAEIKTMLDEGYGQKKGWMDKVLKKKYNDLNETERRAYDEYILNMQLRLQGNKSQSTGEYSRFGSETKLLGNSGKVGPTSGEETPVGPLGTGTEEVPVVSNLETAKINGRSLYEEHDPAKIRQQYLRTIYSLRRLSQVNEDAVSQINDARTEEEVERVIASLPEEQRRYAADYAVQSWRMDAIDEALSTHYADDEVLTDRVIGEVFVGGKESVPVVRLDDKTGIVVLNGMTPEGGVEDASGRVMGVSVPLINGVPDWKSFDGGAVRSYQVKSEDIISMPTQRDVVEFMLADKFAEEGTIFKSSPISVGATFPVLLDGEIRDVSVVGIEIGNWLVEVIGEKGIEPVTNEELEQWKHDAELFPIVQEYAEIDNSINNGERIGEEVRPERNEAHDTVGISAGSQTAHEVGVHQGPTAGVDETAGGRRTRPEDSGRDGSVQGAVAEVPGNGLKESALTRLAVYPEGHAKAGRPDYESSRVEDVRDYLLESLGEEKALKTVDNTISANESRLKEKQDYADRFVVEMENSALEVDDMLRAQEQLKAVESEVATLQKSVDYWKGVRTALGGEEVLMDKQGNPIAADGKLIVEEINSIDDISDDDFNAPTRNIQLPILPLHIDKAIGANGKPVVIKKNIFNKNRKNHKDLGASDSRYILNNVFYNTNMYGQNQKVSRPYNWILIHTADKNSAVIVEVNEGKDNVEVVGWQYLRGNSLEQKKRQAIKEGGLILTLENAAGDTLNGSSSASKDNAGLSDVQEKGEESLPPLDKKVQRRINAAQTREKNRLSAPKEWSEMTKAKTKYNSYPAIMDVLNSTEPSNGNEYAAMWLASNKITPESFRAETGYGLNEQKSFVGMIASAENGGVSIEHAAELLAQDDEYNYFGGDDYNARNALIHVLGEVSNRGDLLHYIDNRRIAEADRMYERELEDEREYLNEITMRDYDMSVDDYEADRVLWNDYMDEVIEERLSGWENFRDSKAYFDLFDIFALESKTEENGREDTRNVLDGREKGIRDDIGNESAGVRESGSSLQGRGIGSRTAIAEGNGLRDSGGGPERGGTFEPSNPVEPSVSSGNVAFESGGEEGRLSDKIASAESDVDTSPTEAQKKAGNYKKGHVQIGSFNVTIEQPKGSVRSGVDKDGKKWSTTMQNTYGYIRGTEGVDGDHIDVFLSNDIDGWDGRKVFVVDQYNPDGSFDEHKVMLGFNDIDEADAAYLSNYGEGWSDSRKIVIRPSTLEDFEKWINSSHRKTKPFAEYKSVQIAEQRRAEQEKSDVLYTVTPTQYTTKKGKELSMHLVTFAKDLSKEQYKAAKEIAKSDKGWYDAKKGGFMMRSEESAKDLAERVVSEGAAPIAEAQPSDASKKGAVKEQQPSKVEDDKYKPVWEYHVSVDKETGRTTLSRDDVSGIIPIGDGRFKVYADSPEEMLDILRNPLNRMDEVLKEVEVTLENKITTRDLDRKIREEREQKRAELRKNGVNGYKIGEKVVYTPISSSRKAIEATIHDFEEYGTNKPVLDTGLGPVMYEVADWDRIKKSETVKENAAGLQESDKNISFEESQSKEIDNGRRIEKENSGLRKESGQEVERAERRGDVGGLHGNNVSDTSGGGRVSVGDGEQLTSVARVNNSRNYSFGENHLDLPTGEIGKLKGNIEAIRLLKELEESGRVATDAEKEVLRQFVGWGGLSESLNEDEYSRWQRYQKITTWDGIPGSTPWGKKYGSHYEALRPLLSDEEFKQAQASTLNSHYTPEVVIRGMWSALEQLGFKGGDILEPAMGIGHMIGFMPKEISGRSTIFGYELDSIPGRIARQLYPDAFIEVAGYETSFRPNSKDAVVTNVPFGQTAPIDPSLDKTLRKKLGSSYNLHNYFIVKGLLELRPGGVGAFVTSSSTMDGRNSKAREYISSLGVDLVGAIRLPNTAFKSNAGTEVTADLLFFRKRYPGEAGNGISFVSLSEIGKGHYIGKDKHGNDMLMEVPLLVNEYFATHPEMMLGEMMTAHDAGSGGLYGGDSQTLVGKKGADLGVELMTAISNLPENILTSRPTSTTAAPKERTSVKDGVLSVKDGKVYVSDSGVQSEVTSGTFKHEGKVRSYADAAKDYLTLKESLKDLIRAEQTETADPVGLRSRVNSLYDDFVSKYGRLNENHALNVILEEDVERFLPQSLEKVETVYDASGRRRKVVSKADGILLRRVSQPMKAPEKADNLQDAIDVSQSYYGRMDINYISKLLNITPAEARERILSERQGYEDPLTGDLIDRDAYLSGNVREKLNVAREAAARDERFSINVSDLEQSLPETIPFVDISYKLGTPWIPEGVYQEFAQEVLGLNGMSIRYVAVADEFMITGGHTSDYTKANEYNTPHRDAIDIFTDAINMRKPTIYRQVDRNTRVKDEAATQEVVAKIVDMNDAFVRYIQEKSDVHSELQRIYNERYNNYRLREYRFPQFTGTDGKIHYPGSNELIALRDHQTKAVQRCLQGSTLLAHQVGTGKTFTMITTAMEMRRLGLAKKPMIVVQNATLQDFASDFMKLYPGANILVPDENERSAKHRKRLFNLIATGDFDAIIVPQSFLAFIPDDPGRKKALIEQRVEEIMQAAEQLDDRRMADRLRREAKALSESISVDESTAPTRKTNVKKQAKKEESALARETRKLDRRTDDVLTFEQMGVDALFIDEAHNFKKIGFTTKMQNVKGIDTGYSERANSLLLKASYVQERNGGRNVILATGTPITNTMAEVWTMMRFVAPEILEDYGIKTFDEFAATFGQVEPSLEQNSTGGFKISDRFKSYVNVPELVKAFRSHADVVLTSDVPEFKKKNSLPRLKDDKMTNHVIHKSDALEDVMNVLVEALKADEQKTGKEKTPGLPLVVFSKAKQAAIDLRLINPSYPDDPNSKTNKVVSEVLRVYKESAEQKGIQMVFCDSYQSPEKEPAIDLFDFDPSVPRFNLYRDIKEKLIAGGIPKDEIVIVNEITSAERKKAVFEKARQGEVRVLIGGTEKMGVGVNVQDRMVALHHMDAPIRPMDFEQRNGRILRQGNMYATLDKPVEILTYGVEGTLDATAYDRLRIKQNFINQMMKGDVSGRVMEDNADDDPSGKTFSQMAAELSGDKTLQLLFVAENKLKKLAGLKRSHEIKKQYAREEIPLAEKTISIRESYLEKLERLSERAAKQFPNGIERITLNGHTFTDKLSKVLSEGVGMYEEQYKENRGIAPLSVKLNNDNGELLFYHNNGMLMYKLSLGKEDVVTDKEINTFAGIWPSVTSALSGLSRRVDDARKDVSERKSRLTGLRSVVQKSFDKEAELDAARAEVSALRSELEKKAQESASVAVDDSVVKEKLKGGRETEVSEPLADYDDVSLYRMENMINDSRSVAVNAPDALVVKSGRDIVNGMPGLSTVEMAFVMQECQRRDVCAMYVPKTRQILILPGHGTAREMRNAYWHESLHYGVDMALPKGDYGRLLLEHAAKDVDELDPELSRWVEEHYGKDIQEEKLIHLLDEVISYISDHGKLESLRKGLNFGPEYPVLNDVCNRLLKYLTDGKEIRGNSGNDVRDTEENYGENQEWKDESQSADVFRGTYEGVGIKHSVLGGDLERTHLRRLKEGETSHVERLFKENKNFDFTSGERINSIEDVAYIFKNLEDESVENSFAVLVDKDGRPTVVHLGMGSYAYSLVNGSALQVAVSRIKPKKITFVHNHPSGTLKASAQDREVLKKLKSTYGANVVTDGIIINLRSGKFGVYGEFPYDSEYKDELGKVLNESAIKVYSFNKLAFSKNYDPSTLPLANSQEAVAEFISSQRLGERDKLGLLVCDQQLRVVGNVFLRESSLTEKNLNQVAQDVVYYTTAMGGTRPILFGNGIKGLSAKLYPLIDDISLSTIKLTDVVELETVKEDEASYNQSKSDGTYMKAPNGQPTNLNEKQWARVRIEPFKKWFGDWEKAARTIEISTLKDNREFLYFNTFKEAESWGKNNIAQTLDNEKTNGKGTIVISRNAIEKYCSESAIRKSASKDVHFAALQLLPNVIHDGVIVESHEDFLKKDGGRSPEYGIGSPHITMHILYGAINFDSKIYRVKVTLKEDRSNGNPVGAYSYEATKIELLDGQNGQAVASPRNSNSSISIAKLLNGVYSTKQNGEKILNSSKVVDANGEPLVVYHGTKMPFYKKKFNEFDTSDGAAWFAEKKEYANIYAKADKKWTDRSLVYEVFLDIKNPVYLGSTGWGYTEESMYGYLSEKTGISVNEIKEHVSPKPMLWQMVRSKEFIELLKKHGYDGIIAEENGKTYAAFRPNQIKSATENNGEYSGENLDIRYSIRRKPAPKNVEKVYKLMRLGADKELYPLFIDAASPVKLGVWYDADSPNLEILKRMPEGVFLVDYENGTYESLSDYAQRTGEKVGKFPSVRSVNEATNAGLRWVYIEPTSNKQKRYEGESRKYWNLGINGSGTVSTFAMRPGWHAGSLPTMRQIGKGKDKNLRDDNFIWTEGYVSADVNYQSEADKNPDKDIPTHIPVDGYYMKATNANKTASQADRVGWYVAGSFMADRIIGDKEARRIIDVWNEQHPDSPVAYDYDRESGKDFDAESLSLVDKDVLEVRYSLRDKPRRRPGESLISYNRRLELWKNELDEAKRRREVENEVRNELDDFPQLQPGEDYSSQSFLDRLEEYRQRIAELRATERKDEMEIVDEALYDPSTLQTETYDSDTSDRMSEEELREVRNAFTQKMKEVKIPVSKEQLKRDIKQEIIERRRYIETSNLEDAIFVDELKKMAGKGKKGAEVLRDIPSYIEGTYTGTPSEELKTCAKKVQDWFEEVYNILAMEGVLYDAPRIQNYVTHIWDWERTPKQVQEAYANWMSTMRLRSPYTRHRIIPSYAEGIAMGMVPKYDDITGIIMEYGHYANEVIANHRILKFLMNFSVKMPGTKNDLPSDMPVITNDKVKSPSYSRMNHTALDGYKVLNVVKPFITPIFGDQKIVDPSHMNPIANKLVDAFWLASGSMKKMVLSFSFFHHGALTETAIAMDRPWGAMKTIAKDLMWDVLVNGNIPAMNDKRAARDAVEHLVSLGATQDYAAADVRNFTTKLAKWAKRQDLAVAKEATQLLDFLNSGSDKLLWDVIHDGFKIASFRKMATEVRAQAEREGWSKEQLENTLDECGQLVNDTYGGLHWDILGFSPKTVRILRALLLSPDWTFATIRQALSPFGVGQLYQQDSFWRRVKDNGLGTTLKETTPGGIRKKYGRQFWLTAMIFFYGVMNALNAYFRVKDEDDEEKKAEEMRQLNPDYRSPYELAYPNGMKWYDYTMAGNALGHQTHLFAGHYSDGTESYVRWGKQFRELPELFFGRDGFSIPGPMIDKISGKVNPLMSTIFTLISGHSLNGFENKDMKNKKGWERDVARLYVLAKAWLPYSVPTQEDKDFMWIDLMMPSSKGMTPYKAIDYFKKAIMSGDSTYVSNVYSSVVLNGLDAAKYLELASRSIEAEAKKNMIEGIETVDDAVTAFDNSEQIKDRKRLVRYIEQQVGAQDFEQVEREEVLNRALDILAGDGVDNKSNDIYVGLMSGEDVLEDYRMKKTIAGLKPYYDDYKSLVTEDADAARRMYNEKKRYIEGYQKAIRYRNAISKLKKTLGKGKDDGVMDKIRDLRKKMFQSLDE